MPEPLDPVIVELRTCGEFRVSPMMYDCLVAIKAQQEESDREWHEASSDFADMVDRDIMGILAIDADEIGAKIQVIK